VSRSVTQRTGLSSISTIRFPPSSACMPIPARGDRETPPFCCQVIQTSGPARSPQPPSLGEPRGCLPIIIHRLAQDVRAFGPMLTVQKVHNTPQ
jgi:hypothetical protein